MRRFHACAATFALFALVTPAVATTLLTLDLGALTSGADRVFVGHVLSVRSGPDASGFPATWTTFAVDQAVKGALPATLTIKQLGARPSAEGGAIFRVPGMPEYREGEKVLLFLNPDSAGGFSSPVGLGQGCFRIAGDGADAVAENDLGNVNLGNTTSAAAARAKAAAGSAAPDATAPGGVDAAPARAPVPLAALIDQIRALDAGTAR